jgi:hypothetical protein
VVRLRNENDWCVGHNHSGFAIERDGSFGWEDTSCTPIRVGKAKPMEYYSLEWTITARCTDYGSGYERKRIPDVQVQSVQGQRVDALQQEGRAMKRLLLIAAALLAATAPANADPLPNGYLGRWCFNGNSYEAVDGKDWETCLDGDGYMEIKRNGWIGHEENCKFISIKDTREKIPREDDVGRDIWKGAWRPVLHITARCAGEGTTWKLRMTFKWLRGGGFSITER